MVGEGEVWGGGQDWSGCLKNSAHRSQHRQSHFRNKKVQMTGWAEAGRCQLLHMVLTAFNLYLSPLLPRDSTGKYLKVQNMWMIWSPYMNHNYVRVTPGSYQCAEFSAPTSTELCNWMKLVWHVLETGSYQDHRKLSTRSHGMNVLLCCSKYNLLQIIYHFQSH
jgi:hypothetical protein